ncbi:MAG TPA: hypothetical protein PK677_10185 [Acidiphilium sp.]|nr:hypothetical protein [Acidiphilium sp.]
MKWLSGLCRDQCIPVAIDVHDLGSGRDPFGRIDRAARIIKHEEKTRIKYIYKFLFLDTDQLTNDHQKEECQYKASRQGNLIIVWQDPCHEAFLIQHIPNRENDRPPTSDIAMERIKKYWPEYRKNMPDREIERKLSIEGARRVAKNHNTFREFLEVIGLLRDRQQGAERA